MMKFIAWGKPGGGGIGLTYPNNGEAATVGNGVMVALAARDKTQVDRLHALALSLGGSWRGPARARSWRRLLCRLFPRPGRQQAQGLHHAALACDG